jgi:beta-glucanase (GH16 family)
LGQGTPVWSDEFNDTALDTNTWEPMIGNGQAYGIPGWGNNELQYYTDRPENVFVSGGNLHIIARAESFEGYDYTSARLRTKNRQDFLYGKMAARIKLPQGQGIWPAFWMLPTDSPYGGWAASGEIDIVESVNTPLDIHGTIHFGDNWPGNASAGDSFSYGSNFADDFHVYAIEWDEDVIRWYVDGILYLTLTSTQWWSNAAPGNPRAPFDHPFHFLLNVAVGGNWPGPPNGSTSFPQEMLVDWVRVYDLGNSLPSVTIDTPGDGEELQAGNVPVSAMASDPDGTDVFVRFYANSTLFAQDADTPYTANWNATEGCHALRAVVIDSRGATATDTVGVAVDADCGAIPFSGIPATIPGLIEVEDFDLGGEGVAYHDCDSSNNGGAYRTREGVDIEAATEGGFDIGWMCPGEWLNYGVNVEASGYYSVTGHVASQSTGGSFRLEIDGANESDDIDVPVTGGWQVWTDVTAMVQLEAGVQQLRFVNGGGEGEEYNITSLEFILLDDHDFDGNGYVDLADWVVFSRCMSAPGSSNPLDTCTPESFERSDIDNDNDVDLQDTRVFQQALTPS